MGIKYKRDYGDINEEMATALTALDSIPSFIGMKEENWNNLNQNLKKDYLQTLADDLFYALGKENKINIGNGYLKYVPQEDVVLIVINKELIKIINLV